jgi:hypothetical protein
MKYILVLLSLVTSICVAAEQKQFQTSPGDNLSYILRSQNYGQTYAEIKPYIDEVIRLNPDAFRDGNPDYFQPGVVLTMPVNPNAAEPTPEPETKPELAAASEPAAVPDAEPTAAIVGSIEIVSGFSEIIRDAEVITVTLAENLFATDEIFTQKNTRAEIRFTDETRVTLGPESRFEINEYSYSGNASLDALQPDSLIATLHRGVFSIIPGLIAQDKNNRIDFRSALTTSIGISGTDFTVRACMEQAHCGDLYGVSAAVKAGSISLKNATAEILLKQNEFGQVKNTTDAPAKAPLPEGFYDLDLDLGKIEMKPSWWQQTLDWFSAYF